MTNEEIKQNAIRFAKFIMNKTLQDLNDEDYWFYEKEYGVYEEKTDEEMYELYLQSTILESPCLTVN
jgi:hypothetical protein